MSFQPLPQLKAKDLQDLFTNYEEILKVIPPAQRYNIYYTLQGYEKGASRSKDSAPLTQSVFPFDLDVGVDTTQPGKYLEIITTVLQIPTESVVQICSGNGFHIIIHLDEAFTPTKAWFDERRDSYKALCSKIDLALGLAGVPGSCDPSVFDFKRVLRVPGTDNIKARKATKACTLIQLGSGTVSLDHLLPPASTETPQPKARKAKTKPKTASESTETEVHKTYVVDVDAVKSGCALLTHCRENPNDVPEPLWHGMLGVTSFMDDTGEISHEYSAGYSGYSHDETQSKMDGVVRNAGPRSCESIGTLWDGCKGCVNFGKVQFPIHLKGEEFIESKDQGFYLTGVDGNGKPKRIPDYQGLWNYFDQTHQYKITTEGEVLFKWDGRKYNILHRVVISSFPEKHMRPYPNNNMVKEFVGKVLRRNVVEDEFFDPELHRGLINLQNGVLNIETGVLLPHSKDRGFLYELPYGYDPQATCPNFLRMLRNCTAKDEAMQQTILEFLGYALSGCKPISDGSMLYLLGNKDNGKSALLQVMEQVFGEQNCAVVKIEDLNNDQKAADLNGKLVNITEEVGANALKDSTTFKNVVTGGRLQVKILWKQPMKIRVYAKFIGSGNAQPKTLDDPDAVSKRFIICPFTVNFSKDHPDYEEGIVATALQELPGILNEALAAYGRFVARGRRFTISAASKEANEEYTENLDPTAEWIKQHVFLTDLSAPPILASFIYGEYAAAMRLANAFTKPKQWFSNALRKIFTNLKSQTFEQMKDGKRGTYYRGIKLIGETLSDVASRD